MRNVTNTEKKAAGQAALQKKNFDLNIHSVQEFEENGIPAKCPNPKCGISVRIRKGDTLPFAPQIVPYTISTGETSFDVYEGSVVVVRRRCPHCGKVVLGAYDRYD